MSSTVWDEVSVTIIPAVPGWYALTARTKGPGNVVGFWREAVVGWRVELCRSKVRDRRLFEMVYPVTLEPPPSEGWRVMKRPDGTVVFDDGAVFESEADAVEHANETDEAIGARMLAKVAP